MNTKTQAETAKKKAESVVALKQCVMEENIISERIDTMLLEVNDETKNSKEDGLLVQAQLNEIEVLVDSQIKSWNHCKSVLDEGNELNVLFERENTLRKKIVEARTLAKGFIAKTNPSASTEDDDARSVSTAAGSHSSSFSTGAKVEKIGLPTFGGNCRAFARFKGDFNNIVIPNHPDETTCLYAMKSKCLKGPAKTLVENLQSLEEVWERLESKYGNSSEVLNLVINDVKSLSIEKKNQERGLVSLVDVLEKGVQDLAAIKADNEIMNTYTINLVEEKLPTEVVKRWYSYESNIAVQDSSTELTSNHGQKRFKELFNFLKVERKNAERLIQLRIQDKNEEEREKDKEKDKKEKREKRYSNLNRDGNKSKSNNNCLIHPTGNHLTRKCNIFLSKSKEERGKIVKDAGGCKLCLSTSHPGSPCQFESKWKPCGEAGCTAHHSRLIHDCGIPELCCHVRYTVSTTATPTPTEETNTEEVACSAAQSQHGNNTLLLIQSSRTATGKATLLWDDGSTLCLVSTIMYVVMV